MGVHFSSDHLSVCPASTFADKKLKSRKEGAASGIKDPSNDRVPCTDFDVTLTGTAQKLCNNGNVRSRARRFRQSHLRRSSVKEEAPICHFSHQRGQNPHR